jgi:hypothetical protein
LLDSSWGDGVGAIGCGEVDVVGAIDRGARVAPIEGAALFRAIGDRDTVTLRGMVDQLANRPCMNGTLAPRRNALLLRRADVEDHIGEDNLGAVVDDLALEAD